MSSDQHKRAGRLSNEYYIYLYLTPNNIPFYVGKGKNRRYKVQDHLHPSSLNRLLKHKIRKVGISNIQVQFLHTNLLEEEAFRQERYWIKYYGRRDQGKGPLCNLTDGGDGSRSRACSEETRQKISNSLKGNIISDEAKQKISNTLKGRIPWHKGKKLGPRSDETKQKLSNANKGKKLAPLSNEHRQKISNALRGRTHTDETKQKIGAAHKGRKVSAEGKQRMREAWKRRRVHGK